MVTFFLPCDEHCVQQMGFEAVNSKLAFFCCEPSALICSPADEDLKSSILKVKVQGIPRGVDLRLLLFNGRAAANLLAGGREEDVHFLAFTMVYACCHSCSCRGPRVAWTVPQPSYQLVHYSVPCWPIYASCGVTCCLTACCCCCCRCTCSSNPEAAAPAAAAKEVASVAPVAPFSLPKSGKIQVQGKVEVKASSTDEGREMLSSRGYEDTSSSPRGQRRVSSLPKQRAAAREKKGEEAEKTHASPKRDAYSRSSSDSSDGRCGGTFVIKGLQLCGRRHERRRQQEAEREVTRDCTLQGTIIFNAE
ncbi:hypothetical protein Efla_004397 [Eimeria flavescens]